MKCSVLFVSLLFGGACAFGYGWESVVGAWAYESDPDVARIIVTNGAAWCLERGKWMPTFRLGAEQDGVRIYPLAGSDSDAYKYLGCPSRFDVQYFKEQGLEVSTNDVIAMERRCCNGSWDRRNCHRMVKTSMPDAKTMLEVSAYLGYWKPVKLTKLGGKHEVVTDDRLNKMPLVKIREDMRVIYWQMDHKPSKYNPEAGIVRKLIPDEGWLRVHRNAKNQVDEELRRGTRDAFWIADDGRLLNIRHGHDEIIEFVRTDKAFPDPIEERLLMGKKGKYHGVWGVSEEFNIFILSFDRGGKGLLNAFMTSLPFDWKVNDEGTILCFPDTEVLEAMSGDRATFPIPIECQYSCDDNTMRLVNMKRGTSDRENGKLRFMSKDVHVLEEIERIEQIKKSP